MKAATGAATVDLQLSLETPVNQFTLQGFWIDFPVSMPLKTL
jgi:hypothetical protein